MVPFYWVWRHARQALLLLLLLQPPSSTSDGPFDPATFPLFKTHIPEMSLSTLHQWRLGRPFNILFLKARQRAKNKEEEEEEEEEEEAEEERTRESEGGEWETTNCGRVYVTSKASVPASPLTNMVGQNSLRSEI